MVGEWRVGHTTLLNVYDGHRPVCICTSKEDASFIVNTINDSLKLLTFVSQIAERQFQSGEKEKEK